MAAGQEQPKPPEPVAAQPSGGEAAPPAAPQEQQIVYSLKVRGVLGFNSDLSGSDGDVTVSRVGANLGAMIPLGERSRLMAAFDYEFSSYDFNNLAAFGPVDGAPFEDVHREAITARYLNQLTRRWTLVAGAGGGLAAEEGADLGQSAFGVGYVGGAYAVSERLQLGGGVVAATQLEDNPLVVPLVIVEWQIDDQWSLSNESRLGLTLGYAPSEAWKFSLGAEYQIRDFRLDSDGPIPDGVGNESRVPVSFTAAYNPTRQLSLEAGIGVNLAQNFEIRDSDGLKLAERDADPAPFLSLQIGYRF